MKNRLYARTLILSLSRMKTIQIILGKIAVTLMPQRSLDTLRQELRQD